MFHKMIYYRQLYNQIFQYVCPVKSQDLKTNTFETTNSQIRDIYITLITVMHRDLC